MVAEVKLWFPFIPHHLNFIEHVYWIETSPPCSPGQMAEVGVGGGSQHLTVDLAELLDTVAEGHDLRGADEGEVQRVEEQDHILP